MTQSTLPLKLSRANLSILSGDTAYEDRMERGLPCTDYIGVPCDEEDSVAGSATPALSRVSSLWCVQDVKVDMPFGNEGTMAQKPMDDRCSSAGSGTGHSDGESHMERRRAT